MDACFEGELRFGAIFVEAGHGEPAIFWDGGSAVHGDPAIGVAGVADDEDADVAGGIFFDGLALADEDFAVDAEEVLAVHTGFSWEAADEEGPVDIFKALIEVGCVDDVLDEGKGAVFDFHADAFEDFASGGDFDEVEGDRLVWAKHFACSEAEDQGVSDVASGAGDSDFDRFFHVEMIKVIKVMLEPRFEIKFIFLRLSSVYFADF